MRDLYYRGSDAFVLVYDITRRSTFYTLPELYEVIQRVKDADYLNIKVPMVVVGTKCDLEMERDVPHSEGLEFSRAFGLPFCETSSKDETTVPAVLNKLIPEVLRFEGKGA